MSFPLRELLDLLDLEPLEVNIYRGRNRDTAWYSVIDAEWPRVRFGFERWLDPENFDVDGRQRRALADCRAV